MPTHTHTHTHTYGSACWRAPGQAVMEQLGGVCLMLSKAASSDSEETPANDTNIQNVRTKHATRPHTAPPGATLFYSIHLDPVLSSVKIMKLDEPDL